MSMFYSKRKSLEARKILRLCISFNTFAIRDWARNNYPDTLMEVGDLSEDYNLRYTFDIIPRHNNDEDKVIFFHRQNFTFSSYLAASQFFTEDFYSKYKECKNVIDGVGWELHRLGYLNIFLYPTNGDRSSKHILLLPTKEMDLLQKGQDIVDKYSKTFKDEMKEKTVEIPTSVSGDELIKVKRCLLGMLGNGIRYRNSLCSVRAYPENTSQLYD